MKLSFLSDLVEIKTLDRVRQTVLMYANKFFMKQLISNIYYSPSAIFQKLLVAEYLSTSTFMSQILCCVKMKTPILENINPLNVIFAT